MKKMERALATSHRGEVGKGISTAGQREVERKNTKKYRAKNSEN